MVLLRKESMKARIEVAVVLGTVGLGSLLTVICTCRVDIIMY